MRLHKPQFDVPDLGETLVYWKQATIISDFDLAAPELECKVIDTEEKAHCIEISRGDQNLVVCCSSRSRLERKISFSQRINRLHNFWN